MKLYSSNENYKLYHGNMLDMLEVIEPNTIDSIITDPPYELNFMGKGWDNSGVAFQKETWQKCYEVLKPGGYLLAFGGSRTFHRIACAIEDAGFEIRDTIMWLYGSGFPKSMDISKQIDKHERRKYVEIAMELGVQPKSNASWRDWTTGEHSPSDKYWEEFKKSIPKEKWENIERKIIGKRISAGGMTNGGSEFGQKLSAMGREIDITEPATDLAKQWQGWGTALKPSFEPIIVARKPFKGSLVDNVIEYGVGGINIDECRVEPTKEYLDSKGNENTKKSGSIYGFSNYDNLHIRANPNELGRFPANTILTYDETDFEEVCGGLPNTKPAGNKIGKEINKNLDYNASSYKLSNNKCPKIAGDNGGSASRYFYCAKASKKDRDEGLDEFEEVDTTKLLNRKANTAGVLWEQGGTNAFSGAGGIKKNTHPTVKPTELMQYLIRLVSPNGATILDPFNGSGSTGKAVMYENKEHNKNYKYIGIELTEEYLPISKARIEFVCKLNEEQIKEMQLSIFDL